MSELNSEQRRLIDEAWQQAQQAESTVVPRARRAARRVSLAADSFPGYTILDEIHRGGQGVVYRAIQNSTQRTIALKVMRSGPFATEDELARFQREVRILARLRHPNIVAIHDSSAAAGRFFYVMEYIAGRPLDQYVRELALDVDSTLRLFVTICEAINAAQLHGVIHRDLKPGNIRVSDDGVPYVLDFGLSKFADEQSDFGMTLTGQFVGSAPWAAPEQAAGEVGQIDLRTDVYSLGVLLYQMLTGCFPYPVKGDPRQVLENIRATEPTPPRNVRRDLPAEVETIILKCLQKQPDRRYQTAGELGRDLQRHLDGLPIEAKRDSMVYLLRKQITRYRLVMGVSLAFVTIAVAGLVTSVAFWRRAASAQVLAERNAERAAAEAANAEGVSTFLLDMLAAADPEQKGAPNRTIREVLDQAATRVNEGAFRGQPLTEAAVRLALGRTFCSLGLYEPAGPHLQRALELRQKYLEPRDRGIAAVLDLLAMQARLAGDLDAAERYYWHAYAVLGNQPTRELGDLLNNLGLLLQQRGRSDDAEHHLRRALAIDRELSASGPRQASTINNLALILRGRGEFDEADALFQEAHDLLVASYGEEHVRVAAALESIGGIRIARGQLDEAEPYLRKALAIRRQVLGEEHPHIATGLNSLGFLLYSQGNYDAAEPVYREALAMRRKLLGNEHPDLATSLNNLGLLLYQRKEYKEAEALYREALAIRRARLGPDHPNTILQMTNLCALLRAQQRLAEAEPLAREAVSLADAALPANHGYRVTSHGELGLCLLGLERFAEAEPELRACYDGLLAGRDSRDPGVRRMAAKLAELCERTDRPDDARTWRERAAEQPTSMPAETP